jgi:hypothetical protein
LEKEWRPGYWLDRKKICDFSRRFDTKPIGKYLSTLVFDDVLDRFAVESGFTGQIGHGVIGYGWHANHAFATYE